MINFMNLIKTYIINLRSSEARRSYMKQLLAPYNFLQVEFITAIEGRVMSEDDISANFDRHSCMMHNGRELNRGEIGCVLSHRRTYETFLKSDYPYALVLEDDISVIRDINELRMCEWKSVLDTPEPTVLFLSGDYWYVGNNSPIVTCYDALGAYAYMINRSAAKLMLSLDRPYYVADDWMVFREWGLNLKAVKPYMIDANLNMDVLSSDVQQLQWGKNREKMSALELVKSIKYSMIKKVLKVLGRFESKRRVIEGKVVTKELE